VYLHAIATQPEYQHRYCVKVAMENGLAVLALASPSGYIFFSGLGFFDVGHIVVKAEE